MGILILKCLITVGTFGGRRNIASGLDLEALPQISSKEPTQECEFL